MLSELAVGRGALSLWGDSVRAENQGQRALTLSPEDGILVTDLLRRPFPMVHLLE